MSNNSKKKQPSEKQPSGNIGECINKLRQDIETSSQLKQEGKDTLPHKDIAILNKKTKSKLFPDAVEIIRPELNIARHADFIFTSPRNKDISGMRQRRLNDLNEFVAVLPGPILIEKEEQYLIETRTPTVTSARIFYAILQIWEEQGKHPDGWVTFSGRAVFKILKIKAGKESYDMLRRELSVLKSSNIYWRFCYRYKDNIEGESEQLFSLITYIKRVNKNLNHEDEMIINHTKIPIDIASKFSDRFLIQIDQHVILGILQGHNKPFNFKEYLAISDKSFDASILYTKIDLYLSTKKVWRRQISKLLEDLGIVSDRYKKLSHRRKKVEEFVEILNGRRISTGLIKASLEEGINDLLFRAEKIIIKPLKFQNIGHKISKENVRYLVLEMTKWVGFSDNKNENGTPNLVTRYAMSYPETVILDTLSRFRADAMNDANVRNKKGVFTAYLHHQVHLKKLQWVGKCEGKNCKYQPKL